MRCRANKKRIGMGEAKWREKAPVCYMYIELPEMD